MSDEEVRRWQEQLIIEGKESGIEAEILNGRFCRWIHWETAFRRVPRPLTFDEWEFYWREFPEDIDHFEPFHFHQARGEGAPPFRDGRGIAASVLAC